ncbi:hypothetical protein DIZ76_010076 [Coccidioides immitis]|nr:hypothetical protein DIZ76_010076 [Coccidioides immitis]
MSPTPGGDTEGQGTQNGFAPDLVGVGAIFDGHAESMTFEHHDDPLAAELEQLHASAIKAAQKSGAPEPTEKKHPAAK